MFGIDYCGVRVIPSPHMADRVQFRFPRSKKRRIRAKWAKRAENYTWVPWPHVYQIRDVFYMHPSLMAQLERGTMPASVLFSG